MGHGGTHLKFPPIGIFPVIGLCLLPLLATAQIDSTPDPFDTFLKDVLDFQKPTGIRGILRYIDRDEQIIWLNWNERSDDGPLFQTGWQAIPGEATLAVYPANAEQFTTLQQFSIGTALELVVQTSKQGKRHILSYQDRSISPKVPL